MKRIGLVVRERREDLGIRQDEAALAAGVSLATWNKLENGRGNPPSLATRRGVCKALDWTPDSIDRILAGGEPGHAHYAHAEVARATATAHGGTVLAASGAPAGMTDEQRAALVHDIAAEVVRLLREEGGA